MELPDDLYPLVLTTKRSLYHYHTGSMTHRVPELDILLGQGMVEINPFDAATLSVKDGETVRVISRRGQVEARAKITGVTPVGVVSMDFHFAGTPTNVLTNPASDPVSRIPELKVCAVRVEKTPP
jgi:anaerobic selenocysteine-containing dehydrogenase